MEVGHGLAGDFCSIYSLQKVISFVVPRLGEDVFMAMATQCPAGEHLFFSTFGGVGQRQRLFLHEPNTNPPLIRSWGAGISHGCAAATRALLVDGTVPRNP